MNNVHFKKNFLEEDLLLEEDQWDDPTESTCGHPREWNVKG